MTQISRPQPDRRTTYPDAGPYTADEWAELLQIAFIGDQSDEAIKTNYGNWLAVTTDGTDIFINTGAALVNGHLLDNDASVTITPTAPGVPATYTVIAMQNNTNIPYAVNLDTPAPYAAGIPAYATRLAVLRTPPGAIIRNASHWMIPLASFTIDAGGAVAALTDLREYFPQIYTENLQDDAVTTVKILNDAVTTVKILDAAVTEAKHNADNQYGIYHPLYRNANDSLQADSGGNARGARAVDLQQSRAVATQVASGADSFVAGINNTASGARSSATGQTTTASQDSAHAEGFNTNATAAFSHAEGDTTTASANSSHAEGFSTTASGTASHAEGGSTQADGDFSSAGGSFAVTSRRAQFSRATYRAAVAGDVQYSDTHLWREVTHSSSAWFALYAGTSVVDYFTVATDQVLTFDALIVGTTQGCTKSFAFRIVGIIENDGGTTSLLASTVTTIYDTDDTDFDARASADNVNDALLIEVTDATSGGDVVRWSAVVRTADVTFPA